MVKTVVTPKDNKLYLDIPDNYIGKEIEVLLYAKEELLEGKPVSKNSMADFCGVLSDDAYQLLSEHTEQARKEWDRTI